MSIFRLLTDIIMLGHSLIDPELPSMLQVTLRHMGVEAQIETRITNIPVTDTAVTETAVTDTAITDTAVPDTGATKGADITPARPSAKKTADLLILTETLPAFPDAKDWQDGIARIAELAAQARKSNPETRIYLAEAWPEMIDTAPPAEAGLQGGVTLAGDDGDATHRWQARIRAAAPKWRAAADEAARRIGGQIEIIPTAQAMARLAAEIEAGQVPGMVSIRDAFGDDNLPNAKGRYLVAMVQAASLTGRNPSGSPAQLLRGPGRAGDTAASEGAGMVTGGLALVLQGIAWETVKAAPPPASPALPQAPAPAPAITNPNLGFGLAGVHDWAVQQPFLDVMKTARPWIAHLPGQWGGWDYPKIDAGGYLDENGWPLAIPPGTTALTTLVLTDLPTEATTASGRYVLTYTGTGKLLVEGRARIVSEAPGRVVFDYEPGPGAVMLTITLIDPLEPIRDIHIIREDRLARVAGGEIFNPDWLDRIRGSRMLRFMDWMATNDATLAHRRERPKPGDFTWARNGVPMEIMVALANQLDAEPWFTLPHLADDDLVREMAEIARDGLKPGLRAWVEYSNEVWNWQFAQARWAEEQGRARWGEDHSWVQYYALRAAEVVDIWAEVFADPQRLVRVISTQTGWLGLEAQILDAPLVRAEGRPAPARSFDAYAVTGYFAAMLGSDEKRDMLHGWLERGTDVALDLAARELRDGSVSGNRADSLADLTTRLWPYHAGVARQFGLELVMYEGGTHVVGLGAQIEDKALTGFFRQLNYSPQMGGLYADLLRGWASVSDAPFNAFVDVLQPSKWGSWGALRHLGDDNPRWHELARGCQC